MSYHVPHRDPSLPVRMRIDGVPSKRWPFEMETIVDTALPDRFPARASRWITRARPKIDRIACPWLVLRFIDPHAEFFYVPAAQVFAEAARLGAIAYDLPGAPVAHEGESCSFDALVEAYDLRDPALAALARIVRAADTGRPALSPQAAGLLAVSQGMSLLHADDHAMLAATLPVYDALYAWCGAQEAAA